MFQFFQRRALTTIIFFLSFLMTKAWGSNGITYEMKADQWTTTGEVEFSAADDSFPQGLMTIKKGSAYLKGIEFENGTIEYDVKIATQGSNLQFRQRSADTAEKLYVRTSEDCPAAKDCLQYTPVTHGLMLWDTFPQYQHSAPIKLNAWNHFKFVISGKRMTVFVNGVATLSVARLEGDAMRGGLQLGGTCSYANFTVTPDAVEDLSPEPLKDVAEGDEHYLQHWQVSQPVDWPSVTNSVLQASVGKDPDYVSRPDNNDDWQAIGAERGGLVNLSRQYGALTDGKKISLTWLKTTIESDVVQAKQVQMGWLDEVWVFVNGKLIFADRNLWDIAGAKKAPDGRLALTNGTFNLPLQKGKNEILVAIDNNVPDGNSHHFGWGLEMRLTDLTSLKTNP